MVFLFTEYEVLVAIYLQVVKSWLSFIFRIWSISCYLFIKHKVLATIYVFIEYGVLVARPTTSVTLMSQPSASISLKSRATSGSQKLRYRPITASDDKMSRPVTTTTLRSSRPKTAITYLGKTTPLLSPICIKRRAHCYNEY